MSESALFTSQALWNRDRLVLESDEVLAQILDRGGSDRISAGKVSSWRETMTLNIELPEKLQIELATEAGRLGLSLSEYTLRLLQERRPAGDLPSTGADLVSYWKREKLIGTRPEITDSPARARRIREQAERRRGA